MNKLQFRVLYREFLFRIVDLEILAPEGDITKLLGQFGGLLIFVSWWLSFLASIMANPRNNPLIGLLAVWMVEHCLIATTMVTVGLFAVMSWESTFPDRRDVLVLSPLPVLARTLLLAKVAAVATALSITVSTLNAFTGIIHPFTAAPGGGGVLPVIRSFAAYWITMLAAGIFIFCCVLTVQGVAQLLPRQKFLRSSSLLQTGFFILLLTVYFLQPPFTGLGELFANQRTLRWVPSYWFFGLFQQLNGSIAPQFAFLARRAWLGFGIAVCGAAASYLICYFRTLRKIAEQSDILPARSGLRWIPRFGDSLQTAVGQFSLRTLLRSRQHRVVLSFYLGIGIGLAMFISVGIADRVNAALLKGSIVVLCAAVVGTRVILAMPLELRANWVFRITPCAGVRECLTGTRRSLYFLSVIPVWIASAALFLWLWPWRMAAEHLMLLGLLAIIIAELCLHGFRKIPFTCSYLPGKSNFNMAIVYLVLFLLIAQSAADLEIRALNNPARYVISLLTLVMAAVLLRWRTSAQAKSEEAVLQFEEAPIPAVSPLDLHRDGVTPLA